mmetsp:Transcript_84091/g.238557  ORF Transcript_84091/g.238557 Transcript_84091/m.238557 type:complete len:207 (+) Transcript_84091:137-757(+)
MAGVQPSASQRETGDATASGMPAYGRGLVHRRGAHVGQSHLAGVGRQGGWSTPALTHGRRARQCKPVSHRGGHLVGTVVRLSCGPELNWSSSCRRRGGWSTSAPKHGKRARQSQACQFITGGIWFTGVKLRSVTATSPPFACGLGQGGDEVWPRWCDLMFWIGRSWSSSFSFTSRGGARCTFDRSRALSGIAKPLRWLCSSLTARR